MLCRIVFCVYRFAVNRLSFGNMCHYKRIVYKMRWFDSKGAFLVLTWNVLISFSFLRLPLHLKSEIFLERKLLPRYLLIVPLALILFSALMSGWLADAKLGNYRVAKIGLVILFIAAVFGCVLRLIIDLRPMTESISYLTVSIVVLYSLFAVGLCSYAITSLQLGLDQMPDASSSSITSFIAWFVFSTFAGICISDLLHIVTKYCAVKNYSTSIDQILGLLPALLIGLVLISDFLLSKKWLIFEPKSPQSLKTMYRVLKFVAKHRAPLNRSALTYWEEDVPSRMDLAKSRYGGPFTTEQVEDVKTILRLLTLGVSLSIIACSFSMPSLVHDDKVFDSSGSDMTSCSYHLLLFVAYNDWWVVFIGTTAFEFLIYPLFRNWLPNIFKKIGIISFSNIAVSTLLLTAELLHTYIPDSTVIWILSVLLSKVTALLDQFLITAMLELVCAQSPYNMRGFFAGYMFFLAGLPLLLNGLSGTQFISRDGSGFLLLTAVKMAVSLFGFILYCLLAHWYKRRVRDDVFSVHRVVEEVYDRYLTAEVAQGTVIQ